MATTYYCPSCRVYLNTPGSVYLDYGGAFRHVGLGHEVKRVTPLLPEPEPEDPDPEPLIFPTWRNSSEGAD